MGDLNDGFGDALTPAEIVAMHEPLAKTIAYERATSDAPAEDLAQEARIRIWELAQRKAGQNDDLRGLASVAMRRRVQEVVSRQTWTGYEKAGGRTAGADPLRRPRESMDAIIEALGADIFGGADALSGVEMAYHEGEILRALCDLTPQHRTYVFLRFWGGATNPEIAEEMGTTMSMVNNWWNRSIRPALATSLAHLAVTG